MKKLVSMLLVLCLVLCSVTIVALADDSDTVTYEITDENMALLEKFKADPSRVSFDELSQAMNDDIVFAAEAYKVLDSISVVNIDNIASNCDVTSDESGVCELSGVSDTIAVHDFSTGATYSGDLGSEAESYSLDPDGYYPSRINRYNWKEGMCRLFIQLDHGYYTWASGFRVGPHWIIMTDLDTGSHARVSVPSCRFFELYHVYRSVWDWFMSEHYGYDGFLSLGQQFTYVSAFPRHVDRLWLCDVTWLDDWFDGSLAGLRRSNSFSPTMFDGHDVEDIVYAE